uniref:Phosphate import ATP-binding protein PstB n=1 Tax=Mycobacterium riyadhense TaxID=486698 RepID=A0A653F2S3_9MYCO|nr:Phosphate import ATP-binding protein PstB [Mycobacterium riyadhense]
MEAVNLTLGFGAKTVLERVSLKFTARAVTSWLGPTGSGKTTLLRTLNRRNDKALGYRYSGDVLLGGRSICDEDNLRPSPVTFAMSSLDRANRVETKPSAMQTRRPRRVG